ncbi:MAG: hypothetical protein A2V66_11565 [Ignavibacteria bacterium RBG_13_36_8]|nr:MAG: hypothetical protein A2V66_11565 [Ignavibacteria bacterium RBG_13_36_8]
MTNPDQAVKYFSDGYSCSQSILSTFAPEFGLEKETALKISSTFGGGIARTGETCGVITGAIMVLGLKYGKSSPMDEVTKTELYSRVHEFIDEFTERNKTTKCKELTGYDFNIPEQFKKASQEKIVSKICPQIVRDAMEILEKLLD